MICLADITSVVVKLNDNCCMRLNDNCCCMRLNDNWCCMRLHDICCVSKTE